MSSVTESFRRVFPKSFSQWSRVSSRRRRPNAAAVTVFSCAPRLILGSFFASSPALSRGATRLRSCVSTVGPRRLENRPPARAPHGRPYREMGALPSRSRSGSSRRSLTFVIRRTHLRGAAAVVNCMHRLSPDLVVLRVVACLVPRCHPSPFVHLYSRFRMLASPNP